MCLHWWTGQTPIGEERCYSTFKSMGLIKRACVSAGLYWLIIVQVGRWLPHIVLGIQETYSQVQSLGRRQLTRVWEEISGLTICLSFEALSTDSMRNGIILAQTGEGWRRDMGKGNISVGDVWKKRDVSTCKYESLSVASWELYCGAWAWATFYLFYIEMLSSLEGYLSWAAVFVRIWLK